LKFFSYFSLAQNQVAAFIGCLFLLSLPFAGQAQKFELGAGGGVMNYKGDISPLTTKFARPAAIVFARHNVNNILSFRYSLAFGTIFADDSRRNDAFANVRDRSFRTRIGELSAQAEYNFFNYRSEHSRRAWSPYLFGGVALFRFWPVENQDPDYRTLQIGLPFGVGIKYVLGGQWNLGLEFGARKTFTDYLDDLGGPLNLSNRFQNGNPNDRDMYFFTGLTISYTFYKVRCPDFY
jgi:hypothetical protein